MSEVPIANDPASEGKLDEVSPEVIRNNRVLFPDSLPQKALLVVLIDKINAPREEVASVIRRSLDWLPTRHTTFSLIVFGREAFFFGMGREMGHAASRSATASNQNLWTGIAGN